MTASHFAPNAPGLTSRSFSSNPVGSTSSTGGFGRNVYDAVNRELGLSDDWSAGEIPAGLIDHVAGASSAGSVVFEVWESREAQAAFMENRLGAALQAGGVRGPPSRVDWLADSSHHLVG
jgi:hypothetical protein